MSIYEAFLRFNGILIDRIKGQKGDWIMLKTSQLEIFVAAVDCGTLNRAAEYLHTSQPYLSKVLKSMEEELGKVLLERGKQGVIPTQDGKFIYDYARSILRDLKKIDEFKGIDLTKERMSLSVSLYSFFINKNIFLRLISDKLSNSVDLSVKENNMGHLFESLLNKESEIGIAVINDIEFPAVQSAALSKNISYEVLDVSPLYVHVGLHQRAFEKEEVYIKDLIYSTYLHTPFDQYSKARLEIRIDGYQMKEFKQVMSVDNHDLMIYLLQETDCFIFGNKWQKEIMSRKGIKSKVLKNTDIRMHLVLFTRNEKHSAEAEKLKELFLMEYLNSGITKNI